MLNRRIEAAVIQKAMAFPMDDVLLRYAKETGCSMEVAKQHEREIKRFLAICALTPPGEHIGMKGPLDKLWHTFIIFTKPYSDFCRQVAGRYIHHYPVVSREAKPTGGYINFQKAYLHLFGEVAPSEFWPPVRWGGESDPEASSAPADCEWDCAFKCDKCNPGCEPVPCDNREPLPDSCTGTDTDDDSDSDTDTDRDTDSDVDKL